MVTISVAMATYNGAKHLGEQLESLSAQTMLPCELVVGDDGSTDETLAILDAFKSSAPFPVHVVQNPHSLGYGENFIRTAARCTGEWIAFCDQDDVWLPHKMKFCADRIAAAPTHLRLINHEAHVADDMLRPVGRLYNQRQEQLHHRLSLPPEWFSFGLTQVFCAPLLRDLPMSSRVSFPWHHHREAHDVWVALLANLTGSILLTPEPLVLYRRHEDAATASGHTNLAHRLRDKLRNNGPEYEQRADYLKELATKLRGLAAQAEDRELAEQLQEASERTGRQASFFEQRSGVYRAATLRQATLRLTKLYGSGAYTDGPWAFGRSRFVKDGALAFLQRSGLG
jgi:glycosyltransferase involved in cell wall biosynthesis